MPHIESDRAGIVIALVLDGQGGAIQVGWHEVEDWKPGHGALWLQLDATSPRAAAWLTSQGEGLATLGINDRRPRLEVIDDQTIRLGLRAWLPTLGRDPSEPDVTNLWLQPMRAVVVSRGLLAELPEIGVRLANGTGPKTIPALAFEQLGAITRRITEAVADLEQPMADAEFAAASGPGNLEELRRLRLQIADLRRYLTPVRVVVERLLAAGPMWLIDDFLPRLSTIAEDLRSDEAEAHTLLERVGTLRDFMADRRATRMNEILYVLTLVSTIMLPLTFITSVFGMNVGIAGSSVRGMSSTLAFVGTCAALAIIAWLEYRFLVRRNLIMRTPPPPRSDDANSIRR
jgi:zinc transporter